MKAALLFPLLAVLLAPSAARGDDAGAPEGAARCVEKVPEGAQRPVLRDEAPTRGTAGYAVTLRVTVEHGKGESVLPSGLALQASSELAKELRAAGFAIPEQDASAGARLTVNDKPAAQADRTSTLLELPMVALPPEPGRHVLVLPALPVAVARANGELMTLCTRPHQVMIDDATASTPNAEPRPNPPPRPQREEWVALERALAYAGGGVVVGSIVAYLLYRWSKRPKKLPPPPPPRPPWEVALEQFDEIRHAGLLEVGRQGEYFDRVSDTLRRYLGARYGFDGLESTTDEVLRALQRSTLVGVTMPELVELLQECDLVKFAKLEPSPEDCRKVLLQGEHVVRATTPRVAPSHAFAEGRAQG